MVDTKNCFFDKARPCDLTCKAAFEVDDPVDNVDCYFIWLAHHLGEGMLDMKRMFEVAGEMPWPGGGLPGGGPGSGPGGSPGQPPGPKGPAGPKSFPNN